VSRGLVFYFCILGRSMNDRPRTRYQSRGRNQQSGTTQAGSVSGSSRYGELTGMSRNVTQNSRSVAPALRTR
jgi:hypothetical protein